MGSRRMRTLHRPAPRVNRTRHRTQQTVNTSRARSVRASGPSSTLSDRRRRAGETTLRFPTPMAGNSGEPADSCWCDVKELAVYGFSTMAVAGVSPTVARPARSGK
jgi:hypothetical protein